MKKILCVTAALLAIGTSVLLPVEAIAQVNFNIILGDAPPPVRYEIVPAPRDGYLWAPGFWNWDGSRHVWREGHWERMRPDYVYIQPQWHQENDGWRFERGGWKHGKHHERDRENGDDRDGDHEHKHKHDEGEHCPPGQAKKGNC